MAIRSPSTNGTSFGVQDLAADHAEAIALSSTGRHRDAAGAFAQTLRGCRDLLGAQHAATLTVAGNLAVTQLLAGRRRDGLALLESNLADRVRCWGDEDPRTLTARDADAVALRLAGRVDDAVNVSTRLGAVRMFRFRRSAVPSTPGTYCDRPLVGKS